MIDSNSNPKRPFPNNPSSSASVALNHFEVPLFSTTQNGVVSLCNTMHLLADQPYSIGRKSADCEFFFNDRRVSKRHCQIFFDASLRKLYILSGVLSNTDSGINNSKFRIVHEFRKRVMVSCGGEGFPFLEASNGVFVNGVEIRKGMAVELSEGDRVSLVCGNWNGSCGIGNRIGFVVEKIVIENCDGCDDVGIDGLTFSGHSQNDKRRKRVFAVKANDLKFDEVFGRARFLVDRCRDILLSDDPLSCILRSDLDLQCGYKRDIGAELAQRVREGTGIDIVQSSSGLLCESKGVHKGIDPLSNDLATQSGLGIIDREQKHEEQLAMLPWLKSKNICKNETQNAGSGRCLANGELSFLQVASLSNNDAAGKVSSEKCRIEASESCSEKKILGFPIFGMPLISAKESPSLTSPSMSVPSPSGTKLVEKNRKNRVLDINLPCDADVLEVDIDKQAASEVIVCKDGLSKMEGNSRNQFDLNLSMSEDEAIVTTIPTTNVKMKVVIDLEAPAVPETEEDVIPEEKQLETPSVSPLGPQVKVEQPQDEFMRYATEATVSISSLCCNQVDDVTRSPSERPMVDPLSWFADVASSCVDDMQTKFNNSKGKFCKGKGVSSSKEMDDFESMTLQLEEMKEEDYMPKPLVPENFIIEETGTTSLPTRARKGPARRGRRRRDFQRDILPGLTSLSRHEVTEDLQTFGGIMKAKGHALHSGLTRRSSSRNGCGRGRRRSLVPPSPHCPAATIETCTPLMQQLNNVEVGLEDRSLTGWGKTKRRPRRQRCPAGIPPSIRLT